jgi:hypothetical protein
MTTMNRIVSIETSRVRPASHDVIVAIYTRDDAAVTDQRWTARAVLAAMNRTERFYTQAANGRRARVQRYTCAGCHQEHIRTHLSDTAIHDLASLPHADKPPRAVAPGSRPLAADESAHSTSRL